MKLCTPSLLALSCVLCGCASYPTSDDWRRELQAQLRDVVLDDGVSAAEADVIAQNYFARFGPGCGVANRVVDDGAFWVSKTYGGYVPMPTLEPIRVDKDTGRVTWSDGPTVEDPKTIW